jgi:RND family efflux transporter MFP subunit
LQPPDTTQTNAPSADNRPHGDGNIPVHTAPDTGRRLGIGVSALAVALLIAFLIVHHHRSAASEQLTADAQDSADAATPVDVIPVEYAPTARTISLPGEAAAWYASTIYARVSGYVNGWSANIGDRVSAGQVLAKIDTPELDDQLAAARAKVAADQSEVAVAESDANFAKVTNQRWKDSPKGVVSDQERDEKQAAFDSATARLAAARAQVQLDQADVNRLEALSAFKNVVAPFDGVITRRQIDIGDLVTAGSTASTTPLYDIAQFDKVRVFVDVPQVSSSQIKQGMAATATSREFAGRAFVGTVARTSHSIDAAAKTLKVEVDIANPTLALLPGTYLEVNFKFDDANPPLRVPASALNFRSNGPEVAVVDSHNVVRFHTVTIARDMGEFVEIGSGLSQGDLVALNISNQIADGDRVIPHNEEPDAATTPAPKPDAATAASQ